MRSRIFAKDDEEMMAEEVQEIVAEMKTNMGTKYNN
jgi:hypothetical protein